MMVRHSKTMSLQRVRSFITASRTLTLIEQSIVSATRFLTTIIIGRVCGASDLGLYAAILAILLLAGCSQESLISRPFTVYNPRLTGAKQRDYSGSVLLHLAALRRKRAVGFSAGSVLISTRGGIRGRRARCTRRKAVQPKAGQKRLGAKCPPR